MKGSKILHICSLCLTKVCDNTFYLVKKKTHNDLAGWDGCISWGMNGIVVFPQEGLNVVSSPGVNSPCTYHKKCFR